MVQSWCPWSRHRLKLESLITVGDSKETEKLNAVEQEKDLPAESVKSKKFLGLTWDKDGKKLVLLFEGGARFCGLLRLGKGKMRSFVIASSDEIAIISSFFVALILPPQMSCLRRTHPQTVYTAHLQAAEGHH